MPEEYRVWRCSICGYVSTRGESEALTCEDSHVKLEGLSIEDILHPSLVGVNDNNQSGKYPKGEPFPSVIRVRDGKVVEVRDPDSGTKSKKLKVGTNTAIYIRISEHLLDEDHERRQDAEVNPLKA